MVKRSVLVGMLCLGFGGCGGDEAKSSPGTVNSSQAQTSVMSSAMLKSAVDSMLGPSVASSVLAVNSSAQGIVSPTTSGAKALVTDAIETMNKAETTTGTESCTATKCTFTGFGSGGYTMDGTVDIAAGTGDGKNIKWNVTLKGASVGAFTFTGKGNIDISSTSLGGEVSSVATISGASVGGQTVSGGSTTTLKYTAVVLSSGTPTGGSLWAKTVSTGSSGGQTGSQAYEGTLTFGK